MFRGMRRAGTGIDIRSLVVSRWSLAAGRRWSAPCVREDQKLPCHGYSDRLWGRDTKVAQLIHKLIHGCRLNGDSQGGRLELAKDGAVRSPNLHINGGVARSINARDLISSPPPTGMNRESAKINSSLIPNISWKAALIIGESFEGFGLQVEFSLSAEVPVGCAENKMIKSSSHYSTEMEIPLFIGMRAFFSRYLRAEFFDGCHQRITGELQTGD